jgi:hypothetical protein
MLDWPERMKILSLPSAGWDGGAADDAPRGVAESRAARKRRWIDMVACAVVVIESGF